MMRWIMVTELRVSPHRPMKPKMPTMIMTMLRKTSRTMVGWTRKKKVMTNMTARVMPTVCNVDRMIITYCSK